MKLSLHCKASFFQLSNLISSSGNWFKRQETKAHSFALLYSLVVLAPAAIESSPEPLLHTHAPIIWVSSIFLLVEVEWAPAHFTHRDSETRCGIQAPRFMVQFFASSVLAMDILTCDVSEEISISVIFHAFLFFFLLRMKMAEILKYW